MNPSLYYSRSGGSGPILVAIHGSGGDRLHWPEPLRSLSSVDVFALDLPGHGRSGGTGCGRVEDYADAVAAFVEKAGLEGVALAGHSLGGAIAMELALRRPRWLARLVLVGTGARLRVAPAILDGLRKDFTATVELLHRWAFGPGATPEMVESFRQGLRRTGPETLLGDFSACDRFDIMDRVDRIRVPTLVIAGTEDRLTPVKYAGFLKDKISGAELACIRGAGHMMALERPAPFVRRIIDFMENRERREKSR